MSERKKSGNVLGSLYPVIKSISEESEFRLSFLRDEHQDLTEWKERTREALWHLIPEKPDNCDFNPQVTERVDKGDYIREKVYFNSAPGVRVPAYVLIPKVEEYPAPGLICFHDHGGMYYWGKEKIVQIDNHFPALSEFKDVCYSGRSYATEFCRAGFVVIVIDAFYWGERRYISDEQMDRGMNDWSIREPKETVAEVNATCMATEDTVARAIYQLGGTWQGLWLRDDIQSLNYLLTRPEVDPNRIGCVGLSIGGFRSAQFAGMAPQVKCAIVVGWMTTYAEMFSYRPANTHYFQYITGSYRLLDLPDLVSMCCPGALMVIHGRKDALFTPKGVADAYDKIRRVYQKAAASDRVRLCYYDTPHEFNSQMQDDALRWLKQWL